MSADKLYNDIARFSSPAPTLTNGQAVALRVDENRYLTTTTDLPTGSGSASKNALYGRPARYNENLLTLSDGDFCAIQVDENGNTVITN